MIIAAEMAPKNWVALNLRLSLFFDTAELVTPEPQWLKLFGSEPANQARKPSELSMIEDGVFKCSTDAEAPDGMLQIARSPKRADFLLTSILDATNMMQGQETPSIGSYGSTTAPFQDIFDKWLNIQEKPILRVAYGAVLGLLVEDRAAAYSALNDLLPAVKVDVSEDVSDFSYGINRKRKSSVVPNLTINRLSTWRSIRQRATLTLPDASQRQTEKHLVFLELDINTDMENTTPFAHTQAIAKELQDLAVEISNRGDVP